MLGVCSSCLKFTIVVLGLYSFRDSCRSRTESKMLCCVVLSGLGQRQ